MATRPDERMIEPDMNPQDLWLEEVFTDRRVGTIRRMTPVDGTGARDAGREVLYVGETQVMSQLGALPINFVLEAKSLDEAAKIDGASPLQLFRLVYLKFSSFNKVRKISFKKRQNKTFVDNMAKKVLIHN